MEILLKLTIPNKTIKDLDEVSEKLGWGQDICWWDLVEKNIDEVVKRLGGTWRFMRIVSKRKKWRLLGR